jgi:hypothetical protein
VVTGEKEWKVACDGVSKNTNIRNGKSYAFYITTIHQEEDNVQRPIGASQARESDTSPCEVTPFTVAM